jgi:hypothetical protein
VCERAIGGDTIVSFHVTPTQSLDIHSLFIYVYLPKFPDEPQPPAVDGRFLWYAVRVDIDPMADGFVPSGAQLKFATARQKLTPANIPAAGEGIGFNDVFLGPNPAKVPSQVYLNVMDTVPIMEWVLEQGLPNTSLQNARKILFESTFGALVHADEPSDESFHDARDRVRRESQRKDLTATFQSLVGVWCAEWSDEDQAKALSK